MAVFWMGMIKSSYWLLDLLSRDFSYSTFSTNSWFDWDSSTRATDMLYVMFPISNLVPKYQTSFDFVQTWKQHEYHFEDLHCYNLWLISNYLIYHNKMPKDTNITSQFITTILFWTPACLVIDQMLDIHIKDSVLLLFECSNFLSADCF